MYAKKQPAHRGTGNATNRPFKQLQRSPLKPIKKALLRTYEASLGYGWEYHKDTLGSINELIEHAANIANLDPSLAEAGQTISFTLTNRETGFVYSTLVAKARGRGFSVQIDEAAIDALQTNICNVNKSEVTLTVAHETPRFHSIKQKIVGIYNMQAVEGFKVKLVSSWKQQPPKVAKLEDLKKFYKKYTQPLFDNMGNKILPESVEEVLNTWQTV